MKRLVAVSLCLTTSMWASPVSAQSLEPSVDESPTTGTVIGTIVDMGNRQPVPDVVVTLSSEAPHTEALTTSDARGDFRFPQTPAGTYTLRFEREHYKPYARSDISLRAHRTVRVDVHLIPEHVGTVVLLIGVPPVVDVGSTTQGIKVDTEFMRRIPLR
ncbi:carboxypeptidase-like regulatory domain-containing protein [Myxococcus stipitatus]|uniref:carboxypeptidase-like regulatory domain-containing protein n=1 Tax=Myxococcus stipitatus TaxID=83455 RepID=UPI001F3EB56B|nr:carboxypeptidase-like regulatory domain-containing protein [Myxococcus stipitatus]MCE9668368.1 carboxypeptidase-like regulatory domain-containing protein [Myxococcus stipitatus]